jgi:hypothetical protein
MGALSSFVLPLVAGVGTYFLVLVMFPTLNTLLALIVGIVTAWAVRAVLKRIHP